MQNIKTVVQVRSSLGEKCVVCKKPLWGEDVDIASKINHYLKHGYQLLCVGIEGTSQPQGQANLEAVAILGKGEKVK